jgi:hypothetical protein
MVWLSGMVPSYEAAAEVFQRVTGRAIPGVSVWRQTKRHGERLRAYCQQQQEHVRPERVVLPNAAHDHHQRKGVSMDGGMLHVRGEGWKEFKVGTVFNVLQHLERDPHSHELVERPHAAHIGYTAVLGSVQEFAPALWALSTQHDVPQADDTSVTADGAEWIWNLVADQFPDSVQIVDFYHACQHLSQAAAALFPDDPEQTRRWYHRQIEALFQGGASLIATHLQSAGLPEHALYFHTHQRRMQYQEFRENGYPIGSGTVESGIKQFKHRLTGPGMRWNRPNAEVMLVIRAAVLAGNFDYLWAQAA